MTTKWTDMKVLGFGETSWRTDERTGDRWLCIDGEPKFRVDTAVERVEFLVTREVPFIAGLKSDPKVMGGSLCIPNTRFPISVVLRELATGLTLAEVAAEYEQDVSKLTEAIHGVANYLLGLKS